MFGDRHAPVAAQRRAVRACAAPAGAVRAGRGARIAQARHRGMVLPGALMLASMMLATSAAWLEISIAQARHAANVHDHIRATQAADGALALCAQALRAGLAPVLPARGDPAQPTEASTFEDAVPYEPVPSWAGSARPPQCAIEAVAIEGRADASVYRITARGFGANASTQARLQLMIMLEDGKERRAWRRIVAAAPAR
jgi:Tfp pilus assembly protein PilX